MRSSWFGAFARDPITSRRLIFADSGQLQANLLPCAGLLHRAAVDCLDAIEHDRYFPTLASYHERFTDANRPLTDGAHQDDPIDGRLDVEDLLHSEREGQWTGGGLRD